MMNPKFLLGMGASDGFMPAGTMLPMAYADPPAGGVASDLASPVNASQGLSGNLLAQVGPRSAGLPTGSDFLDSLVTRAYDLTSYQFTRRRLLFWDWADTRITRQSHNGAVVALNFVNDLDDSVSTATLVENFDVLPTPLSSYATAVILNEYGRVVTSTALLRGTTMIPFDPIAAERVGRNAGATLDRLAYSVLTTAGGITNAGAANGAVPNDVTVSGQPSNTLRAASQYFKDNNIDPFDDGFYHAAILPSNETALRKEADAAGWRYWEINQNDGATSQGKGIMVGKVGSYEGFMIQVTTGVGAAGGVFAGKGALVRATSNAPGFGDNPQVVVAPVIDRLRRFASVGWYWLGGFARFRAEAVCTGNLAG